MSDVRILVGAQKWFFNIQPILSTATTVLDERTTSLESHGQENQHTCSKSTVSYDLNATFVKSLDNEIFGISQFHVDTKLNLYYILYAYKMTGMIECQMSDYGTRNQGMVVIE